VNAKFDALFIHSVNTEDFKQNTDKGILNALPLFVQQTRQGRN
jgi:hypothetical protein